MKCPACDVETTKEVIGLPFCLKCKIFESTAEPGKWMFRGRDDYKRYSPEEIKRVVKLESFR